MYKYEKDVIKVMPMFMVIFVSSASLLGAINIISPQLMVDFEIGFSTVSLLAMVGILVIGLASVIYSTLSDKISIRKLMIFGLTLFNIGALLAIITASINFYLFVASVAIMILGGTSGSGLMIVTATRFLPEDKHAKYFGFNTACVGVSQLVGVLAGGFVATYIGWKMLFALPFISLLTIPSIIKYVPDEKGNTTGKMDVLGLGIFTMLALFVSLFFTISTLPILAIAVVLVVIFAVYITKNEHAFISVDFFKNKNFVIVNLIALVVFGLQSAFPFLIPFLAEGFYDLTLDKVSLVLLPTFIGAAVVGASSGKIVEKFGAVKALAIGITSAIVATVLAVFLVDKGILLLTLLATLFTASFAMMYAPFMKLITGSLKPSEYGVGIGFFNLITGIGPSLLIGGSASLLSNEAFHKNFGFVQQGAAVFSNIYIVYVVLLVVAFIALQLTKKKFDNEENI